MTDSREHDESPTYPPVPYSDLEKQERVPQTADVAPASGRSREQARGDTSFDEDTEALLHATESPATPFTEKQPVRSSKRRGSNIPDVLARPLVNAGYKTPSNFLVLLGIAGLVCIGYLLSIAFVGFTRYGRTLCVDASCHSFAIHAQCFFLDVSMSS